MKNSTQRQEWKEIHANEKKKIQFIYLLTVHGKALWLEMEADVILMLLDDSI